VWGAWLLFAVLVVVHLLALYLPRAPGPPAAWNLDKLAHMTLFGMVLWAGARAGVPVRVLAVVLVVHAPVSEVIQGTLLPGRSGDWLDAVADLTGLAIAALWLRRSRRDAVRRLDDPAPRTARPRG
jgi:VanZ family protein